MGAVGARGRRGRGTSLGRHSWFDDGLSRMRRPPSNGPRSRPADPESSSRQRAWNHDLQHGAAWAAILRVWISFHSTLARCCCSSGATPCEIAPQVACPASGRREVACVVRVAYWVVRIAVCCGMAKGDSARTGKCKCTDVCAVLDRDDAKVRFRGGLLSVSAPNFNSKEMHFCFV